MQDFRGKTVVITGAGGAIGDALARAFAAEGAKLVLTDIHSGSLEATRAGLEGAEAIAVAGDLTSESDMAAVAAAAFDRFGAVDILVNNAAVSVYAPVWEVPTDLIRWMLEVNLLGIVHTLRQFVPAMIARGAPAHIVNIASMAGMISGPTLGAYSASKHAVVGLTDGLRADLKAAGAPVNVTLVAPGPVKTGGVAAMRARVAKVADPALAARMLAILDETEKLVKNGMEPEDVARQVLLAIRHGLFWVTCPPASERAIAMRAQEAHDESRTMAGLLAG